MSVEIHNIEAEQQLLGAILLDNSRLDLSQISPDWFYDNTHADILRAIMARIEAGRLVSPVTIKDDLASHEGLKELGGPRYLARLAGASISGFAFKEYALVIREAWARRSMLEALRLSHEAIENSNDGPSLEAALGFVEGQVSEVMAAASSKPLTQSWISVQVEAIQQIVDAKNSEGVTGTSTGLPSLDRKIGGMAAADMIVLAGRPSMGKTAIALDVAWRIAQSGKGVFFASLEMPATQLVPRFVSSMLAARGIEIPYFQIRTGRLTDEELQQVAGVMQDFQWLPMEIAEKDCRSLPRLKSAARRAQKQLAARDMPLGAIFIDYLQLLEDPSAKSDYQRVSQASSAVKSLAVTMGVPVVVLSQLNRQVEMREPPIPKLSDLRESGRIEEDADLILLAYRPEYYIQKSLDELGQGRTEDRVDLEAALSSCRNHLQILIPKARGGPTGAVNLRYAAPLNRVWEPGEETNG